MSTIPALKTNWDTIIRQEMANHGITTDEVADQFDAVADELNARGFVEIVNIADLALVNNNDTKKVYVRNVGFFLDSATGPADGINIFAGAGGRFWHFFQLVKVAITDTGEQPFNLRNRKVGLAFPVPTLRPATANQVVAADIMPNGTPIESSNGFAWFDICDVDCIDSEPPISCARVGIKTGQVEIGSVAFNAGVAKSVHLIVAGVARIRLLNDASGTVGMDTKRLNQIMNVANDYVGYTLYNSNEATPNADAILFIGGGGSRHGFLRWSNLATVSGFQGYREPNQVEFLANTGNNNGMVIGSLQLTPIKFGHGPNATWTEVMRIANYCLLIGTTFNPDGQKFVCAGTGIFTGFLNLRNFTPSGSADAAGLVGDHCWDDNFSYVKTSTGWKRAALSTF
jgi:hypothetical protein